MAARARQRLRQGEPDLRLALGFEDPVAVLAARVVVAQEAQRPHAEPAQEAQPGQVEWHDADEVPVGVASRHHKRTHALPGHLAPRVDPLPGEEE